MGILNKHRLVYSIKRLLNPRGEPYRFGGRTLNFKVGSRPIRRKFLNAESDVVRNDVLQIEYFEQNFKPNDVLWDIGSHNGHYSIFAGAVSDGLDQVYSFEPDGDARKVQQFNLELNNLSNKVKLFDMAVSSTDGIVQFSSQNGNANSHVVKDDKAVNESTIINVPSITLNSLLHKIRKPTFVKIDTEGAEIDILREASHLLSDSSVKFICELHPFAWPSMKVDYNGFVNVLNSFGRRLVPLDPKKTAADLPFYGTVLF